MKALTGKRDDALRLSTAVVIALGLMAAAVLGVTSALPSPYAAPAALSVGGLAAAVGAAILLPDRSLAAETFLWAGILWPLAISPVRTRVEITNAALTPTAVLRGALPVACLLIAFALFPIKPWPLTRLEKLLAMFLIIVCFSTVWSIAPWATALKSVTLVVAYACILLLARIHNRCQKDFGDSLNTVVHLIVLATVIGLLVSPRTALVSINPYDPSRRLTGVLPSVDPDFLALLAGVGVVLLLGTTGPRLLQRPYLKYSFVIVDISVVLLTRTRTAIIIILAALLVLAWNLWRKHRLLIVAGFTVTAVALAVALLAGGPFRSYLARQQSIQDLITLTGRTQTWSEALSVWSTHPLTGLGYYSGHRFGLQLRPGAHEISNIDSMWIETLLDVGIIGVIPLTLFVLTAGVSIGRRPSARLRPSFIATRRALFAAGILSSLINPSLQSVSYGMVIFGMVILGAPPLESGGHRPPTFRATEVRGALIHRTPAG